jgi:hypothetical protein
MKNVSKERQIRTLVLDKYIIYVLFLKGKVKQFREIGKCKTTDQRLSSTPSPTVSTPSPP